MNELIRVTFVGMVVWWGLSTFKAIAEALEEEELARVSAGESDYQRTHTGNSKMPPQEAAAE